MKAAAGFLPRAGARMVAGLPLSLLLGGVAMAIGIAAITVLLLLDQRAATLRDARAQLRDMSLALANQADRALESVTLLQSSLLDRVIAEPLRSPADFVARMSGQAIHHDLRNRVQNLPVLEAIIAVDANGDRFNTSREWPTTPVSVADRDYFRALRQDRDLREFFSEPLVNRGSGTWTIFLARQVRDATDDFAGLILAAIDLRYFERLYGSLANENRAYSLVREDGVLLARSPPAPSLVGQKLPPLMRLDETDFVGDGEPSPLPPRAPSTRGRSWWVSAGCNNFHCRSPPRSARRRCWRPGGGRSCISAPRRWCWSVLSLRRGWRCGGSFG